MENFLLIVLGIFIGLMIALAIKLIKTKPIQTMGNLRIDNSDPMDGPYLFLELASENLGQIYASEHVTLKVVKENYISQK